MTRKPITPRSDGLAVAADDADQMPGQDARIAPLRAATDVLSPSATLASPPPPIVG